jgi:hypothetical protein
MLDFTRRTVCSDVVCHCLSVPVEHARSSASGVGYSASFVERLLRQGALTADAPSRPDCFRESWRAANAQPLATATTQIRRLQRIEAKWIGSSCIKPTNFSSRELTAHADALTTTSTDPGIYPSLSF